MSELVSIIIPVYNAAPFLEECLQSVAGQSYKSIEAIVINDGSTDNSEAIIKRFIEGDNRFKLHSQENHGLGYTRNRGISLSKGKYVFFLDSDDTIPEKAIESLTAAIENQEVDYAVGKVIRFNEERKYVPIRHLEFNLYTNNQLTTISKTPELLQDSIACNKLWKKDFLVKNNLWFTEGKLYEDLSLTLKGAVLAGKIGVIKDIVYHWRVREGEEKPSITQQQMKLQNTLDRLSALSLNRQWLTNSRIEQRIIQEHDLKSLLDVIRLHVTKYALIEEEDRHEWQESVISFLNEIPAEVSNKLPVKESIFYKLVIARNFNDLHLFSQMATNTEEKKIVEQEGNKFYLRGISLNYDVTQFLKPTVIVKEIIKKDSLWIMSGDITIPKASVQTEGVLYLKGRKTKEVVFCDRLECKPGESSSIYPFEKQRFEVRFDPKSLVRIASENTFDFYFMLANYAEYRSARVQINFNDKKLFELNEKGKLHETYFGNLSFVIEKRFGIKRLLNKILSI
ncbi:glycosyltransferase family 2 protein [Cytobacillus firmus]|uniref:glycosyltransferase family 2 protein n=1 Tax=Cytobacillus firmus TaxID=1399 RepID=UPI0024C0EF33|nr:glycosyltransferase family 2 protein [Cytobacillus firmus]WHY33824.1 glycosyltransferase family 2 protein [Cytobacillus firmus]